MVIETSAVLTILSHQEDTQRIRTDDRRRFGFKESAANFLEATALIDNWSDAVA